MVDANSFPGTLAFSGLLFQIISTRNSGPGFPVVSEDETVIVILSSTKTALLEDETAFVPFPSSKKAVLEDETGARKTNPHGRPPPSFHPGRNASAAAWHLPPPLIQRQKETEKPMEGTSLLG